METPIELQNQFIEENVTHLSGLNSAEVGILWNSYMLFSMLSCVLEYIAKTTDDPDIRALVEMALETEHKRVSKIMEMLNKADLPIPMGFTIEDIDLNAPKLYSDIYHLYYLKFMNRHIMTRFSYYYVTSVDSNLREFFALCNNESMNLYDKICDTSLSKGVFVRPPNVIIDKEVDYVKKQNFLTGFFGEKRPLLSQEVGTSFFIIKSNYIGKYLLMGFRQVASSKEVREYMNDGVVLSTQYVDTFGPILSAEDIPIPMIWDSMVTDSTTPPFSEKLMMFHTLIASRAGTMEYGVLQTNMLRHDLITQLFRLVPETMKFAEDGLKIMIKNGWLEEPPRLVDRRELINEKSH